MYENQIHRHESSRSSSSAMKKQLSNSTMHGSTEIIAKESSHQSSYTRYKFIIVTDRVHETWVLGFYLGSAAMEKSV